MQTLTILGHIGFHGGGAGAFVFFGIVAVAAICIVLTRPDRTEGK